MGKYKKYFYVLIYIIYIYIYIYIFLCYRKIKVWDLVAALDPRALTNSLCIRTLVVKYFIHFILLLYKIIFIMMLYIYNIGTHRSCISTSVR